MVRPFNSTLRSLTISSENSLKSDVSSTTGRWAPDHSRDSCNKCAEKFSILNRRHHCRLCGLLFCQKCSRYKVKLNSHAYKSRVCEDCFPNAITGSSPPMNSMIHSRAWVPRGVFAQMLSYLDKKDLCVVSNSCRWWYKRASLDVIWRPLYLKEFAHIENQSESMGNFHRNVHGVDMDCLSFKKKFAIHWSARKAREKKKSFQVMSTLLASLGLSKYQAIFEAEEIDVDSLCLMNSGHFRELGIPTGPRLKLLNAAACLADLNENSESDDSDSSNEPTSSSARLQHSKAKLKQYRAALVRRVQQSIVRIAVVSPSGQLCNVGSGTIIHERGLVATARHVLVGDGFDAVTYPNYMILVAPNESTSRPPLWKYRGSPIRDCTDEELDVALLWLEGEVVCDPPSGIYIGDVTERTIPRKWSITDVEGSNFENSRKLPAVPIGNSNNIEPGDELWMFGYPSSGHNTITVHHAICSGTDSQFVNGRDVGKAWLRAAAQLDNGFSGGAALDRKGQLVGLISFSVMRQDRVRAINFIRVLVEKAKADRLGSINL